MSQEDIEKFYNYIENDDTENFYTLLSDIISENKDNELYQKLNNIFEVIVNQINTNNYIQKFSFLCLFCEILISENIEILNYLTKIIPLMLNENFISDENVRRLITVSSTSTTQIKDIFGILINFTKISLEYLYVLFNAEGFKNMLVENLADYWEFLIDCLEKPEIKTNTYNLKIILQCLDKLIIYSEDKFKPYASTALYQALDFLTETDVELQKQSLEIINDLTKFCDEQLQQLADNIIDFLNALQNGKNEEIINLCHNLLKHFKHEEDNNIIDKNEISQQSANNDINNNNELNNNELNNDIKNDNNDNNNDNYNKVEKNSPKIDTYEEKINNNNNKITNDEDEIKEDFNQLRNEARKYSDNYNDTYQKNYNDYDDNYNYNSNKSNNDNKTGNVGIDINEIIKRIKELSDKQIIILDSIEQYKSDTKRIINQKKAKIQALENKVEELKKRIEIERKKKRAREAAKNNNYNYGRGGYGNEDYNNQNY